MPPPVRIGRGSPFRGFLQIPLISRIFQRIPGDNSHMRSHIRGLSVPLPFSRD
jgi:hypothetical protein